MMTVWKFPLDITDVQKVPMPSGADLLHVAEQHGVLTLWARVAPDAPVTDRIIGITGTGNPCPAEGDGWYVGSAQVGPFVWHVWDGGHV